MLLEHGREVARATPPHVDAVDGTAAGDAFTACLVVSLLEGRDREEALAACLRRRRDRRLAIRRTTLTADRGRGRRDTPRVSATKILLDCDPGHDDAIALLLALASPELELLGVTTVAGQPDARQDDRERDPRARVRRARRDPRRRRRRPPARARAVRRRLRPRRDRARRPRPAAAAGRAGRRARGRLPRRHDPRARRRRHARPDRPADERRAAARAAPRRDAPSGSC